MVNFRVACLRKGVVVGRASQALNELHIEHDVAENPDLAISRGALDELKGTIRPLRKNLKTSGEEVRLIEAGVKNVSKLLRGKPNKEALDATKKELREIRRNFRKAVQKGFSECGANMSTHDISHFTNDNAFYIDTHPDVKIE
jgi:hypothetical protein